MPVAVASQAPKPGRSTPMSAGPSTSMNIDDARPPDSSCSASSPPPLLGHLRLTDGPSRTNCVHISESHQIAVLGTSTTYIITPCIGFNKRLKDAAKLTLNTSPPISLNGHDQSSLTISHSGIQKELTAFTTPLEAVQEVNVPDRSQIPETDPTALYTGFCMKRWKDLRWSPMGLGAHNSCLLALVSSELQVMLYQALKNPWKGPWTLRELLVSAPQRGSSNANNAQLVGQHCSVGWSERVDGPNEPAAALLAVGSRAGTIQIWKVTRDVRASRLVVDVMISEDPIVLVGWSTETPSSSGEHRTFKLAAVPSGSAVHIMDVKVHTDSVICQTLRKIGQPSWVEKALISNIKWVTGASDELVYTTPGAVTLLQDSSTKLNSTVLLHDESSEEDEGQEVPNVNAAVSIHFGEELDDQGRPRMTEIILQDSSRCSIELERLRESAEADEVRRTRSDRKLNLAARGDSAVTEYRFALAQRMWGYDELAPTSSSPASSSSTSSSEPAWKFCAAVRSDDTLHAWRLRKKKTIQIHIGILDLQAPEEALQVSDVHECVHRFLGEAEGVASGDPRGRSGRRVREGPISDEMRNLLLIIQAMQVGRERMVENVLAACELAWAEVLEAEEAESARGSIGGDGGSRREILKRLFWLVNWADGMQSDGLSGGSAVPDGGGRMMPRIRGLLKKIRKLLLRKHLLEQSDEMRRRIAISEEEGADALDDRDLDYLERIAAALLLVAPASSSSSAVDLEGGPEESQLAGTVAPSMEYKAARELLTPMVGQSGAESQLSDWLHDLASSKSLGESEVHGKNKQRPRGINLGDICPVDGTSVYLTRRDLTIGNFQTTCERGHPWEICSLTFGILRDVSVRFCSSCGCKGRIWIDGEAGGKEGVGAGGAEEMLLKRTEKCAYCNGWWMQF